MIGKTPDGGARHARLDLVGKPVPALSRKAERGINKAVDATAVYISSISTWEVAILVKQEQLALTMEVREWIRACAASPFVHFVPVNNDIAVASVNLPAGLHNAPAARAFW